MLLDRGLKIELFDNDTKWSAGNLNNINNLS